MIDDIGGIGGSDLARVIETSGDALIILDAEWRYAYVNGPALALIGKAREELIGRAVTEVFPGFTSTPFWAVYQRAVRERALLTVEEFFEPLGRWFDVRAIPLGELLYLHFRDVTVQKQAEAQERALEEHERARLTDIFEQAPAFMGVVRGPGHVFEMANPPYYQLVGHRDILGRPVAEAIPEVVEQGFIGLLDQVYRTGEPFIGRDVPILLRRTPDGPLEERFLDFTYQPLRNAEGEVTGILAHGIDLTERKRAEDALHASLDTLRASEDTLRVSEERYRTLVESIDEGFCLLQIILDGQGRPRDYRFLEVNAAFVRQAGFAPTIGRTGRELTPGLDEFWYQTYGRVALTGDPIRFENHAPALGRWFDVYALRVGAPEDRKVGVLFTDVTKRKEAEKALREQGEYLRRLIESSPDCIKTLDLDGNILSISQRGASLLELADPAAVLGKDWVSFFWEHEQTREGFFAARDAARAGGTGRFQGFCPTATGEPRWWDVAVVPLVGADGRPEELLSVSRDITEQVQAQAALRDSEARLRLLTDAFSSLISYVRPDHRYVFGNRGYAEWFGIAPEALVGKHMIDVLGEETYRDRLPRVEAVLRGEVVQFEGTIRTGDGGLRHTDTTYAPDIGPDGGVRGFFVLVQDTTERTRAERERDALFRQEQERSRQLRQVAEASLVINSTASLAETFQVITDKAREIIGAHQSVVSITRGGAGDGTSPNWSQAINAVSLSDKYTPWRDYATLPDGSGIYSLVCRENRILRLTQAELMAHPAWRGFGAHAAEDTPGVAEHPPMNGWLAVPLVARDGTNLGLIQLSDKYEGEFNENDEAILVQLAQLASVAIENQRLLEEERARAARQAVLNRVNAALRSSLDPEVIERTAVTILGEALGVDRCYMVSYHVAQNYSTVACEYRSRPDELAPMSGRYTISDFGAVMEGLYRSPEPQVVADVRHSGLDADAVAKMEALGMRAYVRVPLYEGGTVVSGIGVAMADEPRAWTPEEVELVQTAAAQVRAVLEVARAHKELEQDRAKQRRIADTLQSAMLLAPPEEAFPGLSVGTHYEPAWDEALVGGDFYDALQLDGGRVALICGDGTGKGLEAARYVSESLFVLRAYLRESPDPAVALTRLNSYMVDGQRFDRRSENALAAVAVAVIDTRTGEARFAAGGAEPPLVVRAATGKAEQIEVSGVVLGANPKTEYDPVPVTLSPGDLVVMSTDGTTEARNRQTRQFFGYEGLLRAAEVEAPSGTVSLNDVALALVERAKVFAGGRLGDDACVVVARFMGGTPADSSTGVMPQSPPAWVKSS